MRLLSLFVSATIFVPFDYLSAQEPPQLEPGQRVRVTLECFEGYTRTSADLTTVCPTHEGGVRTVSADTVVLTTGGDGESISIPLASLTRLEVSQGGRSRGSRVKRGAVIGSIVGGALGLAISVAWVADDCPSLGDGGGCDGGKAAAIAGTTAVLGIGVGLIGAGIGALLGGERWEEVPLDRLRVSFAPRRDGFALGLSVSF